MSKSCTSSIGNLISEECQPGVQLSTKEIDDSLLMGEIHNRMFYQTTIIMYAREYLPSKYLQLENSKIERFCIKIHFRKNMVINMFL